MFTLCLHTWIMYLQSRYGQPVEIGFNDLCHGILTEFDPKFIHMSGEAGIWMRRN